MKRILSSTAFCIFSLVLLQTQFSRGHCQVPCGIYDDHARVVALLEDAATVEKAVIQIEELVKKTDAHSKNQLIRWVSNKESHAQNIISVLADYFLTQRVKPSQEDYVERLKKHHAVILAAMKAKQGVDAEQAKALRASIEALLAYYPSKKLKE